MKKTLLDGFGRRVSYLRVSITDRCNLNCLYCRPETHEIVCKKRDELLSFEEIVRLISLMSEMGVNKVRITGGEPLTRQNVPELVKMIQQNPKIEDLALSTNAVLLDKYAVPLKEAGLQRLNIGLDTVDPEQFKKLTSGDLQRVLRGINAAKNAGFNPIKINVVVIRGLNDNHLREMVDYASKNSLCIRFIEYMPMCSNDGWENKHVPVSEMIEKIADRLILDERNEVAGVPARYIKLKDGSGEVGFITPISKNFCQDCNRLRLTAEGNLRVCLPSNKETGLKELMRNGATDDELEAVIREAVFNKPKEAEYSFSTPENSQVFFREMVQIGG